MKAIQLVTTIALTIIAKYTAISSELEVLRARVTEPEYG
jgi:hypothetical protein